MFAESLAKEKEELSEADKMFKEKDYNKKERYTGEEYINEKQNLKLYFKNTGILEIWQDGNLIELTKEELQAIKKKAEELKWMK